VSGRVCLDAHLYVEGVNAAQVVTEGSSEYVHPERHDDKNETLKKIRLLRMTVMLTYLIAIFLLISPCQ
jgi:hypothetical protein